MNHFELTDDDFLAIKIAANTARFLLTHPDIKPNQVITLECALHALERLPLVTHGAAYEFCIYHTITTEDDREIRFIAFSITESGFEIYICSNILNETENFDLIVERGWVVKVDGYRNAECDLSSLENSIYEFLNLGTGIIVGNASKIDYESNQGNTASNPNNPKGPFNAGPVQREA